MRTFTIVLATACPFSLPEKYNEQMKECKDNHFTLEEGRELYSSAILGGMNNKGNVLKGPKEAIEAEVKTVLDAFGTTGIMIGADCTIQGENISLDYIKTAVDAAHGYVK